MDSDERRFRQALKENKDDTDTMRVYADWLQDQGRYLEAAKMRLCDDTDLWNKFEDEKNCQVLALKYTRKPYRLE